MTMTFYPSRSLVLIDPTVQDHHLLIAGLNPDIEVFVLDAAEDGVEQISRLLADRQNLESIHLISHGQPGTLLLGSTQLNDRSLSHYADLIQGWAKSLAHQASLFLYGCRVAAEQQGRTFIHNLHQLLGTGIAASTTITGHSSQGGDWNLEFTVGAVQARSIFQPQALRTYPHALPILVNESFRNADVTDKSWIFNASSGSADPFLTARSDPNAPTGGLPGGGTDTAGNGVLQLTNNSTDQASFVIYNNAFASNAGLSITFDFFAYDGRATGNAPKAGGDGISFFLIDGAQSPSTVGAFGGSLGYAQKNVDGIAGIAGGYLGVGLDEFGNFANPLDFVGGTPQRDGGPGLIEDAVTIRGRGDGTSKLADNYSFIATSGSLTANGGIDEVGTTNRADAARRARIDITQAGILSVKIDLNNDGDFADAGEAPTSLSNIDIIAANGGSIPSTFKFGFASSTGSATNFHAVRNLVISTFSTPPTVVDASLVASPNSTVRVTGLSGTDAETSIASFTILSLPPAAQGVLFLADPSGITPVTVGQVLTPTQLAQLVFQAGPNFTGTTFTYGATDTDGDPSQVPGTVSIAKVNNQSPTLPGNGTTEVPSTNPITIPGLPGVDPDGSIDSYIITTIPPTSQGTLFIGDPNQGGTAVVQGQSLTPQQLNQLFFRPGAGFTTTNFTYVAVDNLGAISNPRTVTLAGTGTSVPTTPDCEPGINRKGTNGNDKLVGTPDSDRLRGLNGNDRIRGKACDDRLNGGKGRDKVFGNDGNDTLRGQQGNDRLDGGKNIDLLNGGLGRDFLRGRVGNDIIFGRRGNDKLIGNGGQDQLDAGLGKDRIKAGNGDDVASGGRGDDRIDGGRGDDVLNGGLQRDRLFGRSGADILFGRRGNDFLKGGSEDDQLDGGLKNDVLIGGGGADTLTGGGGRDRFVYRNIRHGLDTILDFESIDRISVKGIFAKADYNRTPKFDRYIRLQQLGSDTVVRVDGNGDEAGGFRNLVTLVDVTASSLTASNFLFA